MSILWKREAVLTYRSHEQKPYPQLLVHGMTLLRLQHAQADVYDAAASFYFFLPAMATFLPCDKRQALLREDALALRRA